MKPLRDAGTRPLHWVRVQLLRTLYELRQGNDIFAMLQWGVSATGTTADGCWTLTPVGRQDRDVEVCWSGSSVLDGVYEAGNRSHGSLSLANGSQYEWFEGTWTSDATWQISDGPAVLRIHGTLVTTEQGRISSTDASVLVLLGQYLSARHHYERVARIVGPLSELISGFGGH